MISFLNWIKSKNESFGGSAGDSSNAGLDQPENGEREVTIICLGDDDKPITERNRRKKIVGVSGGKVFSKKKCNCK
jgi:hypothetical protein